MASPAVIFVYADWVAEFPVFGAVSSTMGQSYFNRASNLFPNSTSNPAFAAGVLLSLLYIATSHIAWLNAPRDANGNPASTGQAAPSLVGRINSAAEGSVNVSVELSGGDDTPSKAFWVQTPFGFEFWQASARFRTFRYRARPTRVINGVYPMRGSFGW
jgi:hypothetical protein